MKSSAAVIVCVVTLSGLGFLVGRHQSRIESLECRIERVVMPEDAPDVNSEGIQPPYTVVVYEPVYETHLIPGILGKPGGIVHVPKR